MRPSSPTTTTTAPGDRLSLFVWGSLFFVRDRSSTKFLNLLGVRTFYHKWVEDETSHTPSNFSGRQVRARRASTVLPRNYVGGRASTSGVECNTRLHECESVFRTSDKWYYHSKPTTHGAIGGGALLATHQHSRSTVKRV